jgi:hypothetical protein
MSNYTITPIRDLSDIASAAETEGMSLLTECYVEFTCHEGGTRTYKYTGTDAAEIMAGTTEPSDCDGELISINRAPNAKTAEGIKGALTGLGVGASRFAEYRKRQLELKKGKR